MLPQDDPEEARIRANVKSKFQKFRDQGLGIREIVHLFDAELVRAQNVLSAKGLSQEEITMRLTRSSNIIDFELDTWTGVGYHGSMVVPMSALSWPKQFSPQLQGNMPLSPTRSPGGTLHWPEGTAAAQPIQYLPVQSPYMPRSPSTEQSLVNQSNAAIETYKNAVIELLNGLDEINAKYGGVDVLPQHQRPLASIYFYSRWNLNVLVPQMRDYLESNSGTHISSLGLSRTKEEELIREVLASRQK